MTIDLTTARPGAEVTTHAGLKLVIERCEDRGVGRFSVWFKGYCDCETYHKNGKRIGSPEPHWVDIVAITSPPLTDAERLAEIAKIIEAQMKGIAKGEVWHSIHVTELVKILALAEGQRA